MAPRAEDRDRAARRHGPAARAQVEALAEAASVSGAQVTIDATRLRRIEFSAARMLLEALHGLRAGGKSLVISGLSEINAALLEVMGAGRWAVLVRENKLT